MTIVLQYQFWDLQVTNERFEVKLSCSSPNSFVDAYGTTLSDAAREAIGTLTDDQIVADLDAAYVWDIATGPHSEIYCATGPNGKLFKLNRAGDEITVEGTVLKLGRSVAFGEAEARRARGNVLIAKGRFTFTIIRKEGP